ncbi:MAG: PIG-L family deacetylase [Myxococcales bacterium]|nr:PIG-L family deacetylase [Myxococcales bacterium]MCB9531921.1 PIG-L family deacetylase [Myxococcales bacterium]MCB9533889.1 PIG-L family deacetylase [Myxococcales bacterium]
MQAKRETPLPAGILTDPKRHLIVLAHQDDELPYAGIFSRLASNGATPPRVVFVTNGDGLAHESQMAPGPYAELRRAESTEALGVIGIAPSQLSFLEFSELELYAALAGLGASPAAPLPAVFERVYEAVRDELAAASPDVVWTLAWQGGHPEHDLTHAAIVRAVRERDRAASTKTPIYELPAYELGGIAFRFRPWADREVHRIRLSEPELAAKHQMLGMYPTQARVIGEFRKLIATAGRVAGLVGRRFDLETYFAIEEFAPLASHRYDRSTHVSSRLDYPFDDFEGAPIRFDRTLARVGAAWLSEGSG